MFMNIINLKHCELAKGNFLGFIKDVLLNWIEHDYICCDTDLVVNGRF